MRAKHLLLCTTTLLEIYHVHGHCIDIHSRIVSQGLHYVPGGTNPCTLCICDKGGPKWCKSVLCSPPQNCKSFQVGSSCCEFKCLDDILSSHDNYKDTYDVALRFIATTVTAVLSISLLFFLYNRLKRNKSLQHHNHQHEEQRNLSNVGYIAGNFGYNQHNMGYLGGGNNEIEIRYEETSTNFSLWKPPGNYFPPGEAPPPYEEAMRGVQSDLSHNIHNATTHNTLINSISSAYPHPHPHPHPHQQEITPAYIQCRHEEQPTNSNMANTSNAEIPNISSNTHQYVNVRVQLQHADQHKKHERPERVTHAAPVQAATQHTHHNTQHPQHKPEVSYENVTALKNCVAERHEVRDRPTSSGSSGLNKTYHNHKIRTGTSTSNNRVATAVKHITADAAKVGTTGAASHAVLPSATATATGNATSSLLTSASSSNMADRDRDTYELVPHTPQLLATMQSLAQSQPSSYSPSASTTPAASSYSRYVNDTYNKASIKHDRVQKSMHRTLPKNLRELLSNPDGFKLAGIGSTLSSHQLHHAPDREAPKVTFASTPKIDKLVKHVPPPQVTQVMIQPIVVPVIEVPTHDKPKDAPHVPHKSLLTYQSLSQDEEDYRSECENCKTASVANGDDDGEAMNETMSLQRRPLSESGYELSYRTSLTLPTHSRKQRTYPCATNTREKWFTSMQQTSSEESD